MKSKIIAPTLVVLAVIAFALGLLAGSADARKVSWNTAVSSVYDGISLGGASACLGYRPPSWWRSHPTVAHKGLPCGTKVRLLYKGRKVTATVWDRGPFVAGRDFDQDRATASRLRFPWSVDTVRWRKVR